MVPNVNAYPTRHPVQAVAAVVRAAVVRNRAAVAAERRIPVEPSGLAVAVRTEPVAADHMPAAVAPDRSRVVVVAAGIAAACRSRAASVPARVGPRGLAPV